MTTLNERSARTIWSLVAKSPESVKVDLRGTSPAAVLEFIRTVINGCERRATPIALIRVCPVIGSEIIKQFGSERAIVRGVAIQVGQDLKGEVNFHPIIIRAHE